MNLILLTQNDRIQKNLFELKDNRYSHIQKILKKEVGDKVEAGLLNVSRGKATIIKYTNSSVIIDFQKTTFESNPIIELDIICALPRPQTLKKILPLIATTGVKKLHMINSSRVEKSFFQSPLITEKNKMDKYLFEGLSQGKRVILPEVTVYKKFRDYFFSGLKEFSDSEYTKIILHPAGKNNLLKISEKEKTDKLLVAIGPEGGWLDYEIEQFETYGFIKTELGKSVLRVENAVNAIISQKELLELV